MQCKGLNTKNLAAQAVLLLHNNTYFTSPLFLSSGLFLLKDIGVQIGSSVADYIEHKKTGFVAIKPLHDKIVVALLKTTTTDLKVWRGGK